MGTSKHLYLRDGNVEKLKTVSNMSELVNDLLEAHFKKVEQGNLSEEELEKLLKVNEAKEKYEEELRRINNG